MARKSSAELTKELATQDVQIAALATHLDALLVSVLPELTPPAAGWVKGALNDRIEAQPDTVQTLGVDRLRDLKARHSEFIASIPGLFREAIANKKAWPHYQAISASGTRGRSGTEDFFSSMYRNVVSQIGNLLDSFGLLRTPRGEYSPWENEGPSRWRYRISTGFESRNFPKVFAYWERLSELTKLEAQRERTSTELERAKARELFDSA